MGLARCRRICVRPFSIASATSCARRAVGAQGTCLDGLEVDGRLSPLEEAIGHEAIERYEHALATLRLDEREAIIGRVEMGYSYEELAEVLGKPSPDAARKAAKRALDRLIRQMELPST